MTTATQELTGHTSEAFGADPSIDKTYRFRYRVMDIDDLIPSHTDALAVNPKYPRELQPRIRERAASRLQIDNMAQNLNPKVLLRDTGFLDTGPMIIGSDHVVESGNGRVLALRRALQDYPDKYRLYRSMLINMSNNYGITDEAIEAMKYPVLVRERITDVDRVKFAAEANTATVLGMSPFEQAQQDASRLSDAVIQAIEVGEDESIDQALRKKSNAQILARFFESIPANERATIQDAHGEINPAGMARLKMALFSKTYQGEAGQRLSRIFSESLDPNIKNIESAMFQSLPEMAKAEALTGTGARDKSLSVAPDLAEVIDAYSAIKAKGITVDNYLKQSSMLGERLDPTQKQMLEHMDMIARSPKKTREFIKDVAGRIIDAPPPGQTGLFGESYQITKGGIINAGINKQRIEAGQSPIENTASTHRQGLEKPDTGRSESAETVRPGYEALQPIQGQETQITGTVQTGLAGFGKESAQVEMFGEFSGKEGKRDTLIDVVKEKAKEAAKPLPGQTTLPVESTSLPKTKDKPAKPIRFDSKSKSGEVPTVPIATIREMQESRKPQAQALDLAQQHSIVVDPDSPRVNRWTRDPGSMDIQDVDTRRVTIREVPDTTRPKKEKPLFSIRRRSSRRSGGIDLGADIVADRRGRHLRL